jgi:hypothetical protein
LDLEYLGILYLLGNLCIPVGPDHLYNLYLDLHDNPEGLDNLVKDLAALYRLDIHLIPGFLCSPASLDSLRNLGNQQGLDYLFRLGVPLHPDSQELPENLYRLEILLSRRCPLLLGYLCCPVLRFYSAVLQMRLNHLLLEYLHLVV